MINPIIEVRKKFQQFNYAALQLHETISKQAGFSATEHKYLGFFMQRGALTAGEFAGLSGLTTGAVTGLIDRLEKKKLVRREFDKNDRRKVIIVPDPKKMTRLFEPYYKKFQAQTESLIGSYTKKEMAVIESFLSRSIDLMNATQTTLKQ